MIATYWNISNGDRVRDRINSFTGIVVGRADFLYGCRQVMVAPERLGEKGDIQKVEWIDEDRLEILEPGVHQIPASAAVRGGGPQATMPNRR